MTGAVNIITKKNIDETTVSVTNGISERGDANQHRASLSTGFNFADDRGRVTWAACTPYRSSLHVRPLRLALQPLPLRD